MRIGFDITILNVAQAGVFYYSYNLLRALLEQEQENEYMLVDYHPIHRGWGNPPEAWELQAHNAQVVHCQGLRHRRLVNWRPMRRPVLRPLAALVDRALLRPWSMAFRASMHRQLDQVLDGVDVFHSSDVLLRRQPGALNVVTMYDLTVLLFPEYHTAENRELQLRKYRFAQEDADLVIAISEATKRDVVNHLSIPPERVQVVYGGVDPSFHRCTSPQAVERALAPVGLVPDSYILHVGTIEPRKNLVRLVEAYDQMRKMVAAPVPKLVLAGAAGWLHQDVFERIEMLDLQKEVRFLGRVPRELLPALYNGAILFVYPSHYEGFGLPVLEAMACGVPVIASNVSSLPEIMGEAGLLIEPNETQELVAALARLVNDSEERQVLGAAGLARAELFSWTRAGRNTLAVYENAVGGAR